MPVGPPVGLPSAPMKAREIGCRGAAAAEVEVQARAYEGARKAMPATNAEAIKIAQGCDGWVVVSNDGIEVARRSSSAAMPEHLDPLERRPCRKPSGTRTASWLSVGR